MNTKEKYTTKDLEIEFGLLTFGAALEAHRKCEEVSQKDFAKMLEITPQSLCDLEKGRRIPSPQRAAKIARKIGHPENFWLQLAFQDMLKQENLEFSVSVA